MPALRNMVGLLLQSHILQQINNNLMDLHNDELIAWYQVNACHLSPKVIANTTVSKAILHAVQMIEEEEIQENNAELNDIQIMLQKSDCSSR